MNVLGKYTRDNDQCYKNKVMTKDVTESEGKI